MSNVAGHSVIELPAGTLYLIVIHTSEIGYSHQWLIKVAYFKKQKCFF